MFVFMSIIYEEGDPNTYAGFELRADKKTIGIFNTGNPTVDYLTAMWWIKLSYGEDVHVSGSSSIDHFAFDGGDLRDGEGQYTPEEVAKAKKLAHQILGLEPKDPTFKDSIVDTLHHLMSEITMLEDPSDIEATLDAIRFGDGEGIMVAAGVSTEIRMPPMERLFRNALCDYIVTHISSSAKKGYKARINAAWAARKDK